MKVKYESSFWGKKMTCLNSGIDRFSKKNLGSNIELDIPFQKDNLLIVPKYYRTIVLIVHSTIAPYSLSYYFYHGAIVPWFDRTFSLLCISNFLTHPTFNRTKFFDRTYRTFLGVCKSILKASQVLKHPVATSIP